MRTGSHWGGAIEMAVCCLSKAMRVDVYERQADGFVRISAFGQRGPVASLLYSGRCHYDALELR